jgi:hypothetical protein
MYSYEHSVDLLFKVYCSIDVRRMYKRYSPWKSLEPHFSKALPSKNNYERLSPYLHLDLMTSYTIHRDKQQSWLSLQFIILCNVISKVGFKC